MSAREEFDKVTTGEVIHGRAFTVTTETIQDFGDASLDYNPLHFDPEWMKENDFGGTRFGTVIMHGMQNFALITRTLTDWLIPRGGYHRRLETRWIKPVKLGDTITPEATVSRKNPTDGGNWVQFDVVVRNQHGEPVATGQALAEFRDTIPG
ncbi:MAG: phosphate acetyltransferase [Rhizobiales bacterium NRL2]|jgi:acyl dehydratase|nr:MAG: phosphate acetyltransferase [Rhizobiales bacterium NRL2]